MANKYHIPGKLSWQITVIAVVLIIFAVLVFWSSPSPVDSKSFQVQQVQVTPTVTLLPDEWVENSRQTNGIALGGTILVLIVVVGTLSAILGKNSRYKPKTQ